MIRILTSDPTAIELEAANREEAEAFVGACITTLPQDQQDPQWARALCVDDSDALRQVAATGEQFLLIVGEGASPLPANARKHTIVRVVPPGKGSAAAIVLADPKMRQLIDWVERQGALIAMRHCGGAMTRQEALSVCDARTCAQDHRPPLGLSLKLRLRWLRPCWWGLGIPAIARIKRLWHLCQGQTTHGLRPQSDHGRSVPIHS